MKKLTLLIVTFVLFSILYGKESIGYVYAPTISLKIDRVNNKAIDPFQEITVDVKKVYVSTWVQNITPNTPVKFVWYQYGKDGKKQILAVSQRRVKKSGFVYASLSRKSGKHLPAGEYFVDIILNKEVVKTGSFEVYKKIGNRINEWRKLKEKSFELDRVGKHTQAIKLLEKSIAVAQKETPVNYKHIAISLLNLAITHGNWGEEKKEEYYYRKAFEISKNHRGMGNFEVAAALRGMAIVYRNKKEYKKAIKYSKESLKIFKRVLNRYDEDFISTQDILANTYLRINQVQKAETISQKSIKIVTKQHGKYSKAILNPLSTLARIYYNRKEYIKAEHYLQWALKVTRKHPKIDKVLKSYLLFRLSRLYMQTKEYKKAEPYIKQYIDYSRDLYGQNDKRTIDALNGLMVVYAKTDRIDKAQEIYKEIQKLSTNPIALKSGIENSNPNPCSKFDLEKDKKLVSYVRNKYREVTLQQIKSLRLNRFHTSDYSITLLAPMGWHNITSDGDAILYLLRKDEKSIGKFALRSLKSFQNSVHEKSPDGLIKKAAKLISEISIEEAAKSGDEAKQLDRVKLFTFDNNRIGHFILHRIGESKKRWESYTLIWDGKELYLLLVTIRENELEVGEFLSLLAAKSFCSKGK